MDMNRKFITGLVTVALLCVVGTLGAQNPNYVFSISGPATVAGTGGPYSATALLDSSAGANLQGWSFGVCNNTAALTCVSVTDGSTTLTAKNGAPPDFNEKSVSPGGYTQGVVICFTGCAVLPPGSGYEILIGNYTTAVVAPGGDISTQIAFCDTLGTPAVVTVVVVGGGSIVPTQTPLDLVVQGPQPAAFSYIAPDVNQNYNPGTGTWSLTTSMIIDQDDNGAPDSNTQGFSMGLAHDGAQVAVTSVTETLPFSADFAESALLANGWTIGVVYSFTGANTLVLQNFSVLDIGYANAAGAPLNGNLTGLSTPFDVVRCPRHPAGGERGRGRGGEPRGDLRRRFDQPEPGHDQRLPAWRREQRHHREHRGRHLDPERPVPGWADHDRHLRVRQRRER
jgi:hypothetical protein